MYYLKRKLSPYPARVVTYERTEAEPYVLQVDALGLCSAKEEDIFSRPPKISSDSPVGAAILGRKKAQVVEVHAPSGIIKYKVMKISRPGRTDE